MLPPSSPELDRSRHEPLLRRAYQAGRTEHPHVSLDYEVFAGRMLQLVRRRIPEGSESMIREALERTAAADAFLAIACDEDVAGASERFTEQYLPRLESFAVRRGASPALAGEVVRDLPGDLFAPPSSGGVRTRFGAYLGISSLFTWLATMVLRRLADRQREIGRSRTSEPADRLEGGVRRVSFPAGEPDPSEVVINDEMGRVLGECLRAAWQGLSPREQCVLLFKFRDGLAQREIGRMMAIGEPRVSRIVSAALDRLRRAAQKAWPVTATDELPQQDDQWQRMIAAIETRFQALAPSVREPAEQERHHHGA